MTVGLKTASSGDGVLEITIDRPKANAIDSATSQALGEAFARFRDDDALRVAILTGAGDRFFSAGWDMKAAVEGDAEEYGVGGFGGVTEMFDLDKPVIAALNGMAVGGGFEIALACDLIVASRDAQMWLPEVHLGFVADAGGVLRLPRRLPRAIAVEMLLTGRRMDADEALRWGVVNRLVDAGGDSVMIAARDLAADVVSGADRLNGRGLVRVQRLETLTAQRVNEPRIEPCGPRRVSRRLRLHHPVRGDQPCNRWVAEERPDRVVH